MTSQVAKTLPAPLGLPEGPGPLQHDAVKVDTATQKEWYRLAYLIRTMDDRASKYIRRGMGWSYHARCGGHEGIQIALGKSFRPNNDFLFPYYRDMGTALASGMSPYECFLNGLSRDEDPCSGGRHMSNHFGKPSIGVQNVSSCTGNHTLHGVGRRARAIKYFRQKDARSPSPAQGDSSTSRGLLLRGLQRRQPREASGHVSSSRKTATASRVPTAEQTANERIGHNYTGLLNLQDRPLRRHRHLRQLGAA